MGLVLDLSANANVARVVGARSRSFVLDTSKPLHLIGVSLKPGGGFPFFGPAVGELRNTGVSLDVVWGQQAHDLHDELLEAHTPTRRFQLLERHLLARAASWHARHPAVGYALNAFRNRSRPCSVGEVTSEIGLSPRRFIEVFRQEVGLTPKVFCRVVRFRRALMEINDRAEVDWTNIALMCGYYDQAHFNHDFREFAGVTPSAYLADRVSRNHVRLWA